MIIQMPISDIRPPVPESMRHHYRDGELDRGGYVVKIEPGYVIVLPSEPTVMKCRYCGKLVENCGCGACR